MALDIAELDQTAQLLRVSWRKANNYFASFTKTYMETKAKLDRGDYGPEWTTSRWMLLKAGHNDKFVQNVLLIFQRAIAAEEREKLEFEKQQQAKAKRAAELKEIEERRAHRQAMAADKALRHAEKKARAAERKAEAQRKQRAERAAKRKAQKEAGALATVPYDQLSLDQIASDIKAGIIEATRGRESWINGVLRQAKGLAAARAKIPHDPKFSAWLKANEINYSGDDRAALIKMGENPGTALDVLKSTQRTSLQFIWREEMQPLLEHIRAQLIEAAETGKLPDESVH